MNFLKDYIPTRTVLIISMRYLRSQKRKILPSTVTVLSFLSVSIAIATLIVITSVFNGFETMLTKKVLGFSDHITIFSKSNSFPNIEKLSNSILHASTNIASVNLNQQSQGMIVNKKAGQSAGVVVNGLTETYFNEKAKHFESINGYNNGDFKNYYNPNAKQGESKIILSSALAEHLGVHIGSQILLMIPRSKETIFGLMPKVKTYTVACIITIGMYQYDEVFSFLPIEETQSLFQGTFSSNSIAVTLYNTSKAKETALELRKVIPYSNYNITNWKDENISLIQALQTEGSVMTIVLSLFVCMGMFAIFSNILLMVKEKRKSIAVLRSLGLKRHQVGQIFFISGLLIGFSGIIMGVLCGIGIASNIQFIKNFIESTFGLDLFNPAVYFLHNLPSDVRASNVFVICIVSFIATMLSSIIPAIKAAKQLPAETLRDY